MVMIERRTRRIGTTTMEEEREATTTTMMITTSSMRIIDAVAIVVNAIDSAADVAVDDQLLLSRIMIMIRAMILIINDNHLNIMMTM